MKKKNNWIKIFVLAFLVLTLSGCTTVLKDKDKKTIKNPNTGQNITKNVLCKPTDEAILEIYEEKKVDITALPKCENIKLAGKYEGLWENIFVKPLAYVIVKLGNVFNSTALALITVTLVIRLLLSPVTKKTAAQSENLKLAKPALDSIEAKYKDKTDEVSVQKKTQETMAVYKKHGINPFSSCLFAIIQFPLLFAFLEAINRVPAIFEEKFLIFQMGTTPSHGLTTGNYQYLILLGLVVLTTYLSFKMNKATTNPDTESQMKYMLPVMVGVITLTSFSLPAATAIYWITSSGFTMIQNLITDRKSKK